LQVKEAAVIGVKSNKWMERPMACVVLHDGQTLTREELNKFLEGKVSHWWHVDALQTMEAIPRTSVGKFSKLTLRGMFEHIEVA
jgi:fatty-acyl-CoA synthase